MKTPERAFLVGTISLDYKIAALVKAAIVMDLRLGCRYDIGNYKIDDSKGQYADY